MTGSSPRRLGLLAGLAVVLAGISVADAVVSSPARRAAPPSPASALIADAAASSSVWYCGGPAAAPQGSQAAVLLTNSGTKPVSATLRTITPSGNATTESFLVPPATQLNLPVPLASVEVLLGGGTVGAMEEIAGPLGSSVAPCSSATSSSWYFGHGTTASGAALQIALWNPLPTPAVADLTFVTTSGSSSGEVVPPAYQGVPLAAGAVVVENVADHVPGNGSLAAIVQALSGSVVATEVQEYGGTPNSGLSVVDGASSLENQWSYASNIDAPNGPVFDVVNPSNQAVSVSVSISLVQGRAAPLVMQIPAQSSATLAASNQTRIPTGAVFGITFRAVDGPGIVVARQVAGPPTGPFPLNALTAGQPGGVSRWLVPPTPPGELPGTFAVIGLGSRVVHFSMIEIAPSGHRVPVVGFRGVALAPGALEFLVSPAANVPVGVRPTVVEADGPIAVELDPAPAGTPGNDAVPAWPLLVGPGREG